MRDSVTVSMAEEMQRGVQRDGARQLGLRAHLHRHNLAVGGHQQHIVEGKGFRKIFSQHNGMTRPES